jgi:hypothetical protein
MRPTVLFYVWLRGLAHSHRRPGILAARDGCCGNAQGWHLQGGAGRDRGQVGGRDVDCAPPVLVYY